MKEKEKALNANLGICNMLEVEGRCFHNFKIKCTYGKLVTKKKLEKEYEKIKLKLNAVLKMIDITIDEINMTKRLLGSKSERIAPQFLKQLEDLNLFKASFDTLIDYINNLIINDEPN